MLRPIGQSTSFELDKLEARESWQSFDSERGRDAPPIGREMKIPRLRLSLNFSPVSSR